MLTKRINSFMIKPCGGDKTWMLKSHLKRQELMPDIRRKKLHRCLAYIIRPLRSWKMIVLMRRTVSFKQFPESIKFPLIIFFSVRKTSLFVYCGMGNF
nr:MAG TPA: hypothetical protein [Caudoviricetes sp.]